MDPTGEHSDGRSAGSVSLLFDQVKRGESDAFRQLCDRYLPTLTRTVDRRVAPAEGIDADGVANSVLHSLWRAVVQRGRFHEVHDRDSLRRVLAEIVRQKVRRRRRDATRQKRDDRDTRRETFDATPSPDPGPELLLEIRESIDEWLGLLLPEQRDLVRWQVEGYTNAEVAQKLGCSLRSVERHLHAVRAIWAARLADLGWADAAER